MIGVLVFLGAILFAFVCVVAAVFFFTKAAYHLVRWSLGY